MMCAYEEGEWENRGGVEGEGRREKGERRKEKGDGGARSRGRVRVRAWELDPNQFHRVVLVYI